MAIESAFTLGLQVLTLFVAGFGPLASYHFSKKLFINASKQNWLDALRSDISEVISLSDHVYIAGYQIGKHGDTNKDRDLLDTLTEKAILLQSVRHRVRLRLIGTDPMHENLIASIDKYIVEQDGEKRNKLRDDLVKASEKLIQTVGNEIRLGK